ncbi:MAG: Sec-independent protein translocase protein TatB [Pseudomonadota bacterium]
MLPQFGFTELLLLAVVALIVIGPADLPVMMRKIGQFVAKGRAMANEFRAAFDDIARQTELEELREEIEALKRDNAVTEAASALRDVESEINAEVMRKDASGAQPSANEADAPAGPPSEAKPTEADKA